MLVTEDSHQVKDKFTRCSHSLKETVIVNNKMLL